MSVGINEEQSSGNHYFITKGMHFEFFGKKSLIWTTASKRQHFIAYDFCTVRNQVRYEPQLK